MKIDPENYDLRELRRIADERRADRRDRTSEADEASEEAERETDGRRPRREGPPNRSGRNENRRSRNGRDGRRRDDGERRRDDGARRRNRGESRRRRDGRSERLSRPREGYSDHGEAQDEVVRADRLASELGLGRPFGDSRRDGRDGRGRSENGRNRAENGRGRDDRDGRRYDDRGYDGYDELGYSEYDEGRSDDGSFGRDAEYDRRSDDHPEDVGRFRFDNEVHERPRGRAGETLRQNQLEQLLVHETAAAGDSLEKPYLRTLPNEYAAERVVFDWLEFLVLKGGFKRTMDALRYYLTVDWITEEVETELHDYLIGFSGNVSDTTEFDVDDHHLSLLYVARLTSMT